MALTDKQKKVIIADYVELGSYNSVAKKHGVAVTTVKRAVLSDSDTTRKAKTKKEQNTQDILKYMESKVDSIKRFADYVLDKRLNPKENQEELKGLSIPQLATVFGVVIDKALKPTEIGYKFKLEEIDKIESKPFYLDAMLLADNFQSVRRDILNGQHTEYIFPGGRGSAKSSFVSLEIIELLKNNPDMHALVCRQVADTLRDSVYAQIKWAIDKLGLNDEFMVKVSPLEITHKKTGQKIYFRGADDPLKIKSIKPNFGYIGILWFEELDQFHGDEAVRSVEQSAIRGGDKAFIFKSFNPPKTGANWANKYIQIPKDTRLVNHSTYLTVPPEWLGKTFLEEAAFLKEINPKAYEHEYLGVPNGTGGQVFENVVLREITDDEIRRYEHRYYGLDFGWIDPYAFNGMAYNANTRTLYIYEERHGSKTSNENLAKILEPWKKEIIICDSAEPKSIGDLRAWDFSARGAVKGPGSLDYSMKWLQSLPQIVIDHKRCPYTTEEFTGYEYERTKDGEIISAYPDGNDHHISAVRYAMERVWSRRGQ